MSELTFSESAAGSGMGCDVQNSQEERLHRGGTSSYGI
jgi:hypothetical protein